VNVCVRALIEAEGLRRVCSRGFQRENWERGVTFEMQINKISNKKKCVWVL